MKSSFGLSLKLGAFVVGALLAVVSALTFTATQVLKDLIAEEFQSKAEAIALAVGRSVSVNAGIDDGDLSALQEYVDSCTEIPGVAYVYVQDHEGSILSHTFRPSFPAYFIDQNWITAEELAQGTRVKVASNIEIEVKGKVLHAIDVAAAFSGKTSGVVHVGMDRAAIENALAELRESMLLWGILLGVLSIVLCLGGVYGIVLRPLRELTWVIEQFVSSGDLSRELQFRSSDEVGVLADAVRRMVERLRLVPIALRQSVEGLTDISRRMVVSGEQVSGSAETTRSAIRETSVAIQKMMESRELVAATADALHASAEESGRMLDEVDEGNRKCQTQAEIAQDSAARAADAMEALTTSIGSIVTLVERLRANLDDGAGAVQLMDESIHSVGARMNDVTEMSVAVAVDAESGLEAVAQTLAGIRTARASAEATLSTMKRLQDHTREIGSIVGIIDEITDQASLLALNASILAAQAGARTHGFGVVATAIRGLADRTRTSTQDIRRIVGKLGEESEVVMQAVRTSADDIRHTEELGSVAEGALETIRRSVTEARALIVGTADTTVEHRRAFERVTEAFARIAGMLDQILRATDEQLQAGRVVTGSAVDVRGATEEVTRESVEQAARSQHLAQFVGQVHQRVSTLHALQRRELELTSQVVGSSRIIERVAEQQSDVVVTLERVITDLSARAAELNDELAQFRLADRDWEAVS